MLRICGMSGQELSAISMEDINHLRDLKSSLRRSHGFPMSMQHLVHNGSRLDDSAELHALIDMPLRIVLSDPSTAEQLQEAAEEFLKACMMGNLQIARLLMERVADKNVRDTRGYTALMLAATNDHEEIAQLLVEAGADKDSEDNIFDNTALMLAAMNGHEEIAQLLVQVGADKDMRNDSGNTALMLAAEHGHEEIAQLLLEAGAQPNVATSRV